jgi:hypothetical protein
MDGAEASAALKMPGSLGATMFMPILVAVIAMLSQKKNGIPDVKLAYL